jgi:CheY-like chemotaxis protein
LPIQNVMVKVQDIRLTAFGENRGKKSTWIVLNATSGASEQPYHDMPMESQFEMIAQALGARLEWTRSLGSEVAHLASALKHLEDGDASATLEWPRQVLSLAAVLTRHLSGNESDAHIIHNNEGFQLRLQGSGYLVHNFSLLYSFSLFQSYFRSGFIENRLYELLELADVFFLSESRSPRSLDDLNPDIRQGTSQEAQNSFVNMLHPDPERVRMFNHRILLLEDNRDLAEIVGDMLSAFGYVVCPAYDGLAGLERMRRERFDLVLSDIQMPRLDGLSLLAMLKKLGVDTPVVLMTGYASIWHRQQILDDGAAGFLQKPFAMKELIHQVQQALKISPRLEPGKP